MNPADSLLRKAHLLLMMLKKKYSSESCALYDSVVLGIIEYLLEVVVPHLVLADCVWAMKAHCLTVIQWLLWFANGETGNSWT